MEDIRQDSVLPFDTCFCNDHIRMLKILVPFLDSSLQKYLALYIKYLEIRYILECFRRPILLNGTCFDSNSKQSNTDFPTVLDKIIPYCNPSEKEKFQHIRNLFDTFQNIQSMMEMMESMKELFPEGMDNMSDMASMFGMEGAGDMSTLFNMMSGFNSN